VHETGCNQILACFLLAKSPTTGPNVLKIPFSMMWPPAKIITISEASMAGEPGKTWSCSDTQPIT
jgi:hypothetical protein